MRSLPKSGGPRAIIYLLASMVAAALPLACSYSPFPAPEVKNPFVGDWSSGPEASITIRPDTIIQHQANGESTVLDNSMCRGVFRFVYDTRSRDALVGLIARQPDLRQRLSALLVEPSYPVSELACDRGDQTYVLLDDRQLVAIYRDGDIGAIDRLERR